MLSEGRSASRRKNAVADSLPGVAETKVPRETGEVIVQGMTLPVLAGEYGMVTMLSQSLSAFKDHWARLRQEIERNILEVTRWAGDGLTRPLSVSLSESVRRAGSYLLPADVLALFLAPQLDSINAVLLSAQEQVLEAQGQYESRSQSAPAKAA